LLCPQEGVTLRDTVIQAVEFDTTVTGIPPIGSEEFLILASHRDSLGTSILDTRVIVRYDTIIGTFSHGSIDSAITRVDSAYIRTILVVDSLNKPTAPVTIELYDVDTTATDTVASVLLPLFRPDRLIKSTTLSPEALKDTLKLDISNSVVLDRIARGAHLRVGMRLVSEKSAELRLQSTTTGAGPTLSFRVSPDSAVARREVSPVSQTPLATPFVASRLSDFMILAAGSATTPSTLLAVGGLPVRRSFLRFNLPSDIVDSSTIVRATLLLHQRPTPLGVRRSDTVNVFPVAIVAAPTVTDVVTSLSFSTALGQLGLRPTPTTPADSGVKEFEVVALLRAWKGLSPTANSRIMALESAEENQTSGSITFFSSRAAAPLRPRLQITYVPRASYGVP
jgi:hypothetical protein